MRVALLAKGPLEGAALLAALATSACAAQPQPRTAAPRSEPALAVKAPKHAPSAEAERPAPSQAKASQADSAVQLSSAGTTRIDHAKPQQLRCPEGMALLERPQGPYCIDRWEASLVRRQSDGSYADYPANHNIDGIEDQIHAVSRPGVLPQGYISGEQAEQVCGQSGKRLCEIDEWVRACRGSKLTRYPYGEERRAKQCNDRFKKLDFHPVVRLFNKYAPPGTDRKLMWHPSWMNDPRLFEMDHTVARSGAFETCQSDYGVYDLVGNLHEWVADPEGTFFGGFFMDTFQNGQGCEYRTTGHPYGYHDYSTGFRCCADPTLAEGE